MSKNLQFGGVIAFMAAIGKERRPIMQPKANTTIHGFTEMANMLRFAMEHPGTIHGKMVVRLRNNVESVFSFMKQKFGAVVRAVKERTRTVEMLSKVITHNMTI